MSGFEIFGLLVALPDAIERLIQLGQEVVLQVHRLRHPESLLEDLKAFNLETRRGRLRRQIEIGHQIVKNPKYDEDLKTILNHEFVALQQAIVSAEEIVRKLLERTFTRPFMEAHDRKKLAEQIQLIDSRAKEFIDEIELNHFKEAQHSFTKLTPEVFSVAPTVDSYVSRDVRLVRCHLSKEIGRTKPRHSLFLLEVREYTPRNKEALEEDITNLAEILAGAERANAILDCLGFVDLPGGPFALVFALPGHQKSCRTLQQYIAQTPSDTPPLNVRLDLCRALADAVLHIHTLQRPLVHKNISPANILVSVPEDPAPPSLKVFNPIYLLNWQMSRAAAVATNWRRTTNWWETIYQHPDRQVTRSEEIYTLDHDIYSFGICMIEILLWQRFVLQTAAGKPLHAGTLFDKGLQAPADARIDLSKWDGPDPEGVATIMKKLAQEDIPKVAGEKLSKVILQCIEGLHQPNEKIGAVFSSDIKDVLSRVNI